VWGGWEARVVAQCVRGEVPAVKVRVCAWQAQNVHSSRKEMKEC